MTKLIEISVFKIISIHTGIFSIIFTWLRLSFEGVLYVTPLSISVDYNYIGYITRMNLEALDMTPPNIKMTILFLFGTLYLIGFLLTLTDIKIDRKDPFKILGKIGLLLVSIGIFGYIFSLRFLFYQNQLIFEENLISRYPAWDLYFRFKAGFYFAIATLIIVTLDLFCKYQKYLIINIP